MTEIFLKIVNMSISAGWMVLAVAVLRLLLKKAPKNHRVILWGLVGIRLAVPFSFESIFSLIPSSETVSPGIMYDPLPSVNTGIPVLNNAVNPVIRGSLSPEAGASVNPLQIWLLVLAIGWIAGMMLMLLYTVVSYFRLRRRVSAAVPYKENIYQCETVVSPFVLGVIRPRIYLPFGLDEQNIMPIIAHEKAHIERHDHWWKPLGFLLLTIHWFHPLIWLAYVLLCRDIELACDEKVIRELGSGQRADYSQALLSCSAGSRSIRACPLSFGEVGVKERVKNVLNYKKPAFYIVAAAAALCLVIALCFLTNPSKQRETMTWAKELSADDIASADLAAYPQPADEPIKSLSGDEFPAMVALVNQSKGRYLAEYEELAGGSIFFYIKLKDGTAHEFGNIGNTYLVIDGDYYDAGYTWLSSWNISDFGAGNPLLPEGVQSGVPASDHAAEDAEKSAGLPYPETVIWEDADLDHDGEKETVYVSEIEKGQLYELGVVKKDGTLLWSEEAGCAHTGWNTILLYRDEGQDYLIRYLPVMFQGVGSYGWTCFSLEGGRPSETDSMEAEFELPLRMNSRLRGFAERTNWTLENSTILLSTEQGKVITGPIAAVQVPELYPVLFDPNGSQGDIGVTDMHGSDLFGDGQPIEFFFASGAGAWHTSLTLYPDGRFKGTYEDGEADAAPAYPNGTAYICNFSGRFGEMTKVSEYACSMQMEELIYETEVDKEWIEDQVRYIGSEAYGLAGGEEFILYLPDTPADSLDEEFLNWWPDNPLCKKGSLATLSAYGLYNVETGAGFFTSWMQ